MCWFKSSKMSEAISSDEEDHGHTVNDACHQLEVSHFLPQK